MTRTIRAVRGSGPRSALTRALLGTGVVVAVLLSCSDRTGPQVPLTGTLAVSPAFASSAAGIVPLTAARITIRRTPGGEVVRDTVVTFTADADSVDLTLSVPVLDPAEMFELLIALVTPAGDTAFRAGPVPVKPATSGPPPMVPVTFRYTGIGANAAGVAILTDGATVMAGESTLLVAQALDSAGAPIPGTPIEWVCLDTARAQVARPDSGRVIGKAQRGNARVMARLLTGQTDTTSVSVLLPPASLVAEAGSGQTAPAGMALPDPLVARAVASDGVGVADQWIRFSVATGGGSLSADSVLTDAVGRAAASWTLGNMVGSQIVQASTARLAGVTASFTATAQATGVGGIAIVSGDGQSAQVGTAVATSPSVRVTDAQGNPVPGVDVTFAVASGGGSVTGAAAVTDAAGLAAVGSWVLGPNVGINTLTATADTLTPVIFTATATGPGGAVSMAVSGGDNQTALAGTAVAVAPAVVVRDAASNPVAGVTVNFAVTAGGGSVTGAAALTDAGGIARVGSWTVGLGANSLTATLTGLPPVVFAATGTVGQPDTVLVVSGSGQSADAGTALPQPLVVQVTDSAGNGVPGVDVTWSTLTGSLAPPTSTTDSEGRAQSVWTLGTNSVNQTATAAVAGLTPAVFTATAAFPNPTILLELIGANRIRLGDSAFVRVTLTAPAPTGGAFVTVTSDNPAVVAVDTTGGGGVLIPAGEMVGQAKLFGIGAGTTTIRANASGYSEGMLSVLVSVQVLSMPSTLNVPYGGQASLPIQISAPAPAGGTTVTLVSDNPAAVAVVTPSVVIPAGAQTTNAIVAGVTPGTATVTGTTVDFGTAQSRVSSTANLNIVQTSATINETFGTQLTVQLESGGSPVAAPSPGIAVTMTPRDPQCLATTSPVTIPTGLVSTTSDIAFGGGDVSTPCTTYLVAESPAIAPDSVFVRVNPAPGISVTAYVLGTGLQRSASASLGASNHGGVDVVVTSSDPSMLLIAPDQNTVGDDSLVVTLPNGQTFFTYYLQALEGVADTGVASVPVTVTAPGFTTGTATHTLRRPAFDINGVPSSTTTLSDSAQFYVRVGYQQAGYNFLWETQAVRAGGQPLTATLWVETSGVGRLITTARTGDTVTVQIPVGNFDSPYTVATGGAAFDPLAAGTTTVTGSIPGFDPTPDGGNRPVTVSAPGITVGGYILGTGLQRSASASLGASNHGGVDVVVTSSDPSMLLIAPDQNTVGDDSLVVTLPNGQTFFTYYLQAMEGVADTGVASVPVTVTAPGFTTGTATHTLRRPAFDINGVPSSTTTLSDSSQVFVRVGYQQAGYNFLWEAQPVRAGGQPLTVTLWNVTPGVGRLITTARTGDTVTVQIPVGNFDSPYTVATGGAAFDPLAAGTTTVTGSIPGFDPTPGGGTRSVTVSAPSITVSARTLGTGLQRVADASLGASNHGGVDVVITSGDPSMLLIAPNQNTVGDDSLVVTLPNGQTYFTYYLQALEGVADTGAASVPVTVTAPGFTTGTATHTLRRPAFDINGVPTTTTTLSDSAQFYVRVGYQQAGYNFLWEAQPVRAGGQPLTVTLWNVTPGVGRLITTTRTGDTVTVEIPVGDFDSPYTVGTGGVAFDPLTAGTTTVTGSIPGFDPTPGGGSRPVTVSAPGITVSTATVGSGLQRSASASLGASAHGGVNVTIRSSNPTVARVAPDFSTPGTDSIMVSVPDGATYVPFYVQGMEGQTGNPQFVVRANGFTDGSAVMTVLQPAVDIASLPSSVSLSTGADSIPFNARVGYQLPSYSGLWEVQDVRAGGTALTVTLTSSAVAVADLLTSVQAGDTVTVQIAVRDYRSPTTVAAGGAALRPLAEGTTTVTASIPGFITNTNGIRTVTVNP